jgi:hypothetical protein
MSSSSSMTSTGRSWLKLQLQHILPKPSGVGQARRAVHQAGGSDTFASLAAMADRPVDAAYEVVCPHCGKTFEGELLTAASTPISRGFKCSHCKLFVPFERTSGPEPDDAAG